MGDSGSRVRVLEVLEATVGGTRRHLISLLQGLNKETFSVEVACPQRRSDGGQDVRFLEDVRSMGIPMHFVDMRREINPWLDLRALIHLFSLIRRRKYDLVHLHSSKAGLLGRISAKLNGSRTVYTPHGFYFLNAPNSRAKWVFLNLERLAGTLTDCLISVSYSEGEVALMNSIVPKEKLSIIPNGIDAGSYSPDKDLRTLFRNTLNVADNRVVIGIVIALYSSEGSLHSS